MSDAQTPIATEGLEKLGTYQLNYRMVDVFIDPESVSGSCTLCQDCQPAAITIGTQRGFHAAWDVLVHEAFELSMADHDCTYSQNGQLDGHT